MQRFAGARNTHGASRGNTTHAATCTRAAHMCLPSRFCLRLPSSLRCLPPAMQRTPSRTSACLRFSARNGLALPYLPPLHTRHRLARALHGFWDFCGPRLHFTHAAARAHYCRAYERTFLPRPLLRTFLPAPPLLHRFCPFLLSCLTLRVAARTLAPPAAASLQHFTACRLHSALVPFWVHCTTTFYITHTIPFAPIYHRLRMT